MVLALVAATLSVAWPASAASIVVTTTADELTSDGDCSLREAITAANTNAAVDACPVGARAEGDTITFSLSGTITLSSMLPDITDAAGLTLDGSSYPALTLTANVAADAPAHVTNSATVSGGGELRTSNDTATDPTTIVRYHAYLPLIRVSSQPPLPDRSESERQPSLGRSHQA